MLALWWRLSLPVQGVALALCAGALASALGAVWSAGHLASPIGQCFAFAAVLSCLLCLFQVVGREDVTWFLGVIRARKPKKPPISA